MNSQRTWNFRTNFRKKISLSVKRFFLFSLILRGFFSVDPLWGGELSHTIESIKPSIVGIATFQKTRSPPLNFMGTGFVVGDGSLVVTNAHVAPEALGSNTMESLVVIVARSGKEPGLRSTVRVAFDKEHDLVLLRISGEPLPAMQLGDSETAREGQIFAFTGFPIGMILGFYPVTHRGMLSSITPVVLPALNTKHLEAKNIAQLQKSAYSVFQLDGTAYPGNSGSPLYDPDSGTVYGIINMVFIKGLKETALTQPSGISYAIPSNYLRDLLRQKEP